MSKRLFPRLAAAIASLLVAVPAAAQGIGIVERHLSAASPTLDHPVVFSVYRPTLAPADGSRWPVVYLLEGRPGLSDWLDQGFVTDVIDRAISKGDIPPSLVVMAAAPFSWYVDNKDGQGLVATALTRDLIAAVDARYPTAACREGRAVAGLSMGGYGAALFALERPETYAAGLSFAGAIAPPIAAHDKDRLARADAFYDGVFGRPLDRDRFNDNTLFAKLHEAAARPGPKPALFLAAGESDRGGLLLSTTRLHVELQRAGFETALRIGPGQHDWPTWRRQLAEGLEWLGPRLDPTCGSEVAKAAPEPAPQTRSGHATP